MVRRHGRPIGLLIFALLAALAVALPVAAQGGGIIKGNVKDQQGQAVEGATVTIVSAATARKFQTRTDKKGEFLQIGLSPGTYAVLVEKDKLAARPLDVTVRAGRPTEIQDMVIGSALSAAGNEEAAKRTKIFDEAIAASNAGNHDEAIAKFRQGIELDATCFICWNNVGYSYAQKKDFDQAILAYKKAAELKPDDATAWNGLANIYNAQRKFDLAAEASAKATQLSGGATGESGGADALFNQGVILWNGGKVAEAKKAFEGAVQANPNHAEAHYQLGMVLVNEGNLKGAAGEFETYLKLAPTGPNAATAKSLVDQLKK